MQYSEPITTASSKADNRLKIDNSLRGKKKKIIKQYLCLNKDGKGGPGVSKTFITKKIRNMKKLKKLKPMSSVIKSFKSKMGFDKALKSQSGGKVKALKSMIKKNW